MKTKIMGILNVTPDSFYAESRRADVASAVARAMELAQSGADSIDIGGESTRPGAREVSVEEEISRVIPVLTALQGEMRIPISIDTRKPEVAAVAIQHGATLINDISGFSDPQMRKLAVTAGVDVCVMHMQGTPETMQQHPHYPRGVVQEVYDFLCKRAECLINEGVEPSRIIIDPGIGFGKTVEDNFALIRQCKVFIATGFRVLYGISRKSFIKKSLENRLVEELLPATIACNTFLALSGVDSIRVHDVQAHRDALRILELCYP